MQRSNVDSLLQAGAQPLLPQEHPGVPQQEQPRPWGLPWGLEGLWGSAMVHGLPAAWGCPQLTAHLSFSLPPAEQPRSPSGLAL